MITRRIRLAIAGALLGATALAGARAARVAPPEPGQPTSVTAPGKGPVTFSGTLDRTSVLRGGDGVVRMELVMRAPGPHVEYAAMRQPTDLVIVLDRSGSMMGEKIEHARAAIRELVSHLGAEDRFSLVTYSDGVAVTIPLAQATEEARRRWLSTIAAITAEGNTNMSSGLDTGLNLIEGSRNAGRAARAILISDGLANQGDASP